jgi:glycosyltransferase involved in cell wall biosynthesis
VDTPQYRDGGPPRSASAPRRQLVCLTPVRNEAWVLDRFLRAASMWADAIVVLDHASDDESAQIAQQFPKVHLTRAPQPSYQIHRATLVDAARALVPGPRVLVALDADEFIASDAWHADEMRDFLLSPPGTLARMRWINVLPREPRAWIPPTRLDFMFVDDGSSFNAHDMHGPRLPLAKAGATVDLDGPKVIHLQYLDWERMRAKQRWYQAQERIEHPRKRPIQIYRQYHHMDAISPTERHPLHQEWFAGYTSDGGIDLLAVDPQDAYPTDERVLDLFREHGVERFRRVDLWDGGWEGRARALGRSVPATLIADPRSRMERCVFRWLSGTQARSLEPRVRWTQRVLRFAGW